MLTALAIRRCRLDDLARPPRNFAPSQLPGQKCLEAFARRPPSVKNRLGAAFAYIRPQAVQLRLVMGEVTTGLRRLFFAARSAQAISCRHVFIFNLRIELGATANSTSIFPRF
jgi:hypothetical protein